MFEEVVGIRMRYEELLGKMQDEAVMLDFSLYQKLAKEQKKLQPIVQTYGRYVVVKNNLESAKGLVVSEKDVEIIELAKLEIEECVSEIERLEAELKELLTPRDERDDSNVIMEIRPAAGGDEAALFAGVLLRMYTMFAGVCGFKVEIYELDETEIGGVKQASLMIIGDGAFSKFKHESGVHRVQRVPDTETQGRIHTSTATVAVLPEATEVDIKIEDKDLRIDVYRSSGAGGQHVNKTESAVRITHLPTGTVVTCQDNKSQIKNREKAMMVMKTKLADYYQEAADKEYAAARKNQVGTGDRSERIRTYNFPQGRVTDHRVGHSVYNINAFVNGDLAEMLKVLREKLG